MNDKATTGVPKSFWAIGIITLIWNVAGVANFFMQMDPDVLAAYRDSERAIVEGRPVWATGGFAIAVFGGALACLLLLLRKSAAFYLFVASLVGVLVTTVHTLGVTTLGLAEILGIILLPLAVPAFLIWYSKRAQSKGWVA
jgi:hypothetical protein